MNATRTTLVNGTDVKNITLSNSTAIASLMRSDSTVSLLPSDGVVPARNASSTRQRHSSNASYGGNLQRAAQVVLDLAGLTYAAAAT